ALIVSNQKDDTISIFRGLAAGGFSTTPTTRIALLTGSAPDALLATDINGDGLPDLIAADSGTNSVSILINGGPGTFTQQTYTVGKKPNALAVGDMNGDNRLDVLAADAGDNNVNILTQNASGTFNGAVSFGTGQSGLTGVAVADFNSDGLNDFVVSSNSGVAWLPNTSNPPLGIFSFGGARVLSATAATSVATGELDSDTAADIAATTNNSGGQVMVFTGDGAGNFTNFSYAANPNPTAVHIAPVYPTGHND